MKQKKVMICLSGGIDSSLAALFLKEEGYDVHGVTFRAWDYITESCIEKQKGCCSIESITGAKMFAGKIGISHTVLDLRKHFSATVIKNFTEEYLSGKTPNPCVLCNAETKWGEVMKYAVDRGFDYIATGHYARIRFENNRYMLSKGKDLNKDQSYFLWMLNQEQISRTLFPLGELTKSEIRKIAAERGLTELVNKRESQEICFIPENDYRQFLKNNVKDFDNFTKQGDFISTGGRYLGKHKGLANYTIGQRKGLGIATGEPLYVVKMDKETNQVVLGQYDDLACNRFSVTRCNFIKYESLEKPLGVEVKTRFRQNPVKSVIMMKDNSLEVKTLEPVYGVTPGQSAVFYENGDVVCGGIII